MKNVIIVAPHEDDEIIGCFEVLRKRAIEGLDTRVLYPGTPQEVSWPEEARMMNPLRIVPITGKICMEYFEIPTEELINSDIVFFFPDPRHEMHPAHRRYSAIGEALLRKGVNVFFYSVNMHAPYIRETTGVEEKRDMLELYYSHKNDLWKWDHKYFLFEGQVKWIQGW